MSNYIKITSTVTITVTAGLDYIDATNLDKHIENRLNIKPDWVAEKVMIKKGTGIYPAEIASWNTVKALVKDRILTISEDASDATQEEIAKAEEEAKVLEEAKTEKRSRRKASEPKEVKEVNLEDIAE